MIPEGRLSGKAEYYGRQISSLSKAEAAVKIGYVGQNPDNQIVAAIVEEDVPRTGKYRRAAGRNPHQG